MKPTCVSDPSHPLPLMITSHFHRSASIATASIGAVSNIALAFYLFGLWRSLAWEPGSEWEGSQFSLSRDGARLICGLFSAYFAAASAICVFGLAGIIKVFFPYTTLGPSHAATSVHTLLRAHLPQLCHRRLCLLHSIRRLGILCGRRSRCTCTSLRTSIKTARSPQGRH